MRLLANKIINHLWYQKNSLSYLLWPLSWFYQLLTQINRWFYKIGIKTSKRFPVPMIVVGNISVGGTGKTPLVIALARYLQQQGYRPGIISHGYKAKTTHFPQAVTPKSDPVQVGDEAMLLALQLSCPVYVSPQRSLAVEPLLQDQCNVIITDDGLQHYALARDIEIAVIDEKRRYGNGFCLPAGPLRESVKRIKEVDFVIANTSHSEAQANEYSMQLLPGKIYNLLNPEQSLAIQEIKQVVHAVAGIGHPQRFFDLLRSMGLQILEHPFPDHHAFQARDFQFSFENSRKQEEKQESLIIMTEKDAVKCRSFAKGNFWCLPVTAKLDEVFLQSLVGSLQSLRKV